jgi:phage tail-like protein
MADTRRDPLLVFSFGLQLQVPGGKLDWGDGTAFFKSVSGLKAENEVLEIREGGVNTGMRKLIGPTKWPNLILKQGFTGDGKLWKWRESCMRVNGVIVQLGPDRSPICNWTFVSGWPIKWEGPDFDASKNELSIETIEIAHEGLFFASTVK